jgi:hypothetical protein
MQLLLLALIFLAQSQSESDRAYVTQMAYARLDRAKAVAADPEIRKAIAARNAVGESLDAVHAKDAAWIKDRAYPLRKELTQNACARRLRELVAADELIVEALVMDAQGALVCSTAETSDYWQGDEPKWQRTSQSKGGSFVDEPARDASAGVYAVQLSVLVKDRETRLGAVTLTLRLRVRTP